MSGTRRVVPNSILMAGAPLLSGTLLSNGTGLPAEPSKVPVLANLVRDKRTLLPKRALTLN